MAILATDIIPVPMQLPHDFAMAKNDIMANFVGQPATEATIANLNIALRTLQESNTIGAFSFNYDQVFQTVTLDMSAEDILKLRYPLSGLAKYKTTIQDIVKQTIRNNLLIKVRDRSQPGIKWSPGEERARNTLRDMLTEKDWRRYLTNGFIMIRGDSGYWYQIFSSRENVRVYKDGKLAHNICIHSDSNCPPTDHVINMKVTIEMDEAAIWKGGNVYNKEDNLIYNIDYLKYPNIESKENILDVYKRFKVS
jgi:hypothetical protein